MYRKFFFLAFVQSIIVKFRGTKPMPVWQRALAFSTALVLLASLLWLAPWQGRHDGSAPVPQSMPVQGSDHTAQPTPPPLASPATVSTEPGQVPEAGKAPGEDGPQAPALLPEQGEASSAAAALQGQTPALPEEPVEELDTQAMQELLTRLETARSIPEEHLDTKAMDELLASLAPEDKTTLPTTRRSKVARKRGASSLPRAAAGRGTPGATSPPRSDPIPLRPAPEFQFPDTPKPVHDSIP